MKKLILLTILTSIFSLNLSAVDLSIDSAETQQSNQDMSISAKKSKDIKESESNKESESYTKDISKAKSKEAVRIAQVDILNFLSELELNNVYPFSSCKVLNNPKLPADFGITSEVNDNEDIDLNLSTSLDKAVQNNAYVNSISDLSFNEKKFYDYVNCLNFYSALVAQSLKTSEMKGEIEDAEIKDLYLKAQKALTRAMTEKKYKVKFHKAIDTYTINSLKVRLDYEPVLMFNQIELFGKSFYGYTANSKKSISLTTAKKEDRTASKDNSINLNRTKDITYTNKNADNTDYSFKTNFSIRNYLPK